MPPGWRRTWSSSGGPTPGPWWTGPAPGRPAWCAWPPESRLWRGCPTGPSRGTSSCTRTICPTTSHDRSVLVTHPAVIFGGPSPEHDVSVLTGLQAARTMNRAGHQVEAIYWDKVGRFFALDSGLESRDFTGGA